MTSEKSVFLSDTVKEAKRTSCIIQVIKKVVISRDVRFDENSAFDDVDIEKQSYPVFAHEDDGETHGSTGADDHPDSPIRKTRSLRELYDITDEIENNEVKYYKTEDQMADIFTKPLSRQVFEKHVISLGVMSKSDLRESLLYSISFLIKKNK